jgi:dipeptidyl aminopeptidase/acylaminoacyl peptidase
MRNNLATILAHLALALAMTAFVTAARAQQEFPPPQGKGRVTVVLSGDNGTGEYETISRQIAALGYDAVLCDANTMRDGSGAALKAAILAAQKMPHAVPGKVALVGFSLGGGISLAFGPHWPDLVAGVVEWYPGTSPIRDMKRFASELEVPVLMFAGEVDNYRGCCSVTTARSLAAEAKAQGKPFELVTYPDTQHDFIYGGYYYKPQAYQDASQRMAAALKRYLGN